MFTIPFPTAIDIALIKRDFEAALKSAAGVWAEITYKVPTTPVYNEAYGIHTAASWANKSLRYRALQAILGPKNVEVLSWGILDVGDCLFFLSERSDLSEISPEYNTVQIIAGEMRWNPIGRKADNLHKYALLNYRYNQIAQVIPCKLDRSTSVAT